MVRGTETAINVSQSALLLFSEAKNQEALRIKRILTHDEFMIFVIKVYKRVAGDSFVLDAAWEKVRELRK